MNQAEPSLQERAHRMYRRLLLLQHLFHPSRDDDGYALESGDRGRNLALGAAVREVLDELTEHARVLTSVPFPISEWRPGDSADDERWRALSDVERRELLSLVSGYDSLITWAEEITRGQVEIAALVETSPTNLSERAMRSSPQLTRDATEYLKAERARLGRFGQEMRFLKGRARD